jgi:predicted phage terminase large subunit-like protein
VADCGVCFRPNPGAQEMALASNAKEILFGGQAGGGKSVWLAAGATRFVQHPRYKAIMFRRKTTELWDTLVPTTQALYPLLGAKFHQTKLVWTFPSGATIRLSHMEHLATRLDYDGTEYQYCVAGGTPVLMANGQYKAIEQIRVGEKVATLLGPRRVLRTHALGPKPTVRVETPVGPVYVSDRHRVLTDDGWVSPSELMSTQCCEYEDKRGALPGPSPAERRRRWTKRSDPQRASGPGPQRQGGNPRPASDAFGGGGRSDCGASGDERQESGRPERWYARLALFARALPTALQSNSGSCPHDAQSRATLSLSAPDSLTCCRVECGCDDGQSLHHQADGQGGTPSRAGAGRHCRSCSRADGQEKTQPHSHWQELELLHPYSSEPLAATEDVLLYRAPFARAGETEVFDLTVEEASHYVTWGGIVAQNCGFDELTSFYEAQYTFMFSRLRSAHGIPTFMRATANPGGMGHDWVLARFAAFLYKPGIPGYSGPYAEPGERVWVRRDEEKGVDVYCDRFWHNPNCKNPKAAPCEPGKPCSLHAPQSRTFIPSRLAKQLEGTEYEANLDRLDPLMREWKKNGNWHVRPAAGKVFQRANFTILDYRPTNVVARCRFWDRAATEGDGDWTVGVLMALLDNGTFVVEDVIREQIGPGAVQYLMRQTATLDPPGTIIGFHQDPASAGKFEAYVTIEDLVGFDVRCRPKSIDKLTHARPMAAQAGPKVKNVVLVSAQWNDEFLREHNDFPEGTNDDQVDAASGAFNILAEERFDRQQRRHGGVTVRVLGG